MDTDSIELEERYPGLAPSGTVVLMVHDDENTHSGWIAIDDVVIAEADRATGRFTAIVTCP